jgi:aminoglycoside phosphotransferase (APT) family kinase protein
VLKRLHAIPAGGYGDVNGQIRDRLPDNSVHMARLLERDLRRFRRNAADPALADQLAAYLTRHAAAFAECARPAYCHGDVHEANLLAELARTTRPTHRVTNPNLGWKLGKRGIAGMTAAGVV